MGESINGLISVASLKKGHKAFVKHEPRDPMYKVAMFVVKEFWGSPGEMADGLGVLLLTWNSGFYRYGWLDFAALETCIRENLSQLEVYRSRRIETLDDEDESGVLAVFTDFLKALRRHAYRKSPEAFSPVSVAKALHVLAPDVFPLWDYEIANAKPYRCYWHSSDRSPAKYWQFMLKVKAEVSPLEGRITDLTTSTGLSVLKLLDEFNYSKYTKGWI